MVLKRGTGRPLVPKVGHARAHGAENDMLQPSLPPSRLSPGAGKLSHHTGVRPLTGSVQGAKHRNQAQSALLVALSAVLKTTCRCLAAIITEPKVRRVVTLSVVLKNMQARIARPLPGSVHGAECPNTSTRGVIFVALSMVLFRWHLKQLRLTRFQNLNLARKELESRR